MRDPIASNGPATRRTFMAAMTAAGLGLAATNLFSKSTSAATTAALTGGPTDGAAQFKGIPGSNINFQVLNFALTLEFLEADLYRQALNYASGRPLKTPLAANASSYSRTVGDGGLDKNDAGALFVYLKRFAYVEAAHRDFLLTAIPSLGGTPVSANPKGYKFAATPAANIGAILAAILPLEETGVRAYLGALPYLTDLSLAQVAGTIFSTEARHSAAISYRLGYDVGPRHMAGDQKVTPTYPSENTFEYFLSPQTVLSRASQFFV